MNPGVVFLTWWLGSMALVVCLIIAGVNYDHVTLFVLRAVNAPVYQEARMVAALIYQHPEEWKASSYTMEHTKVGSLRSAISAASIELHGPYGNWEPNAIERLIIWNAVQWYRHTYVKSLLRKEIVQLK
jgi:hypothetical protein